MSMYGTFQTVLLVPMASTCTSNAPNCLARGTSITKASSPWPFEGWLMHDINF